MQAIDDIVNREKRADGVIVFTDEQDCDLKLNPEQANPSESIITWSNAASFKNGVDYGKWTHIDGWAESVIDYIRGLEQTAWVN